MGRYFSAVIVLLMLWLVIGAWRLRRRRVTIGPAAAAMMHELLNDDRRAAIEIILEERAGERDPEDRDGNLPELAHSRGRPGLSKQVHDEAILAAPSDRDWGPGGAAEKQPTLP
jgi:hypothetical protein